MSCWWGVELGVFVAALWVDAPRAVFASGQVFLVAVNAVVLSLGSLVFLVVCRLGVMILLVWVLPDLLVLFSAWVWSSGLSWKSGVATVVAILFRFSGLWCCGYHGIGVMLVVWVHV